MKFQYVIAIGCTLTLAFTSFALAKDGDGNDDNGQSAAQWRVAGQNLQNTRSAPNNGKINSGNVKSLQPAWVFTTGGDVCATPTVAGDAVYFPDLAGNLYAVNRKTGALLWSHQIADYDHVPGAVARVSPAIHGDDLIIGDTQSGSAPHAGASEMSINRQTGALQWITLVDPHPAAIITGSPVFHDGVVYIGVSSSEEGLATNPAYPCCSFRGNMVALDIKTGKILGQTFMLPDNGGRPDGYSGAAIWQPPAVDSARGSLYVGTGNNYEVPQSVKNCLAAAADMSAQSARFPADDHYDSAMALDLNTGQIKWSKRVQGLDVWTVACITNPNPVACPEPSSPDFDFSGSGPNLLDHMVGFGQKSGIYWAFNPDNGTLLWSSMVGPGSTLGGIEWGTATDGKQIFVAIGNAAHKAYPLIDGSSTTGGAWSSLDASSGKVLWQTADPTGAIDTGAVSVADDVVFAPSYSGNMNALNARTGQILWTFQSGGSVVDGPSIVDGTVYWGSGYKKIAPGVGNNKLYAFTTSDSNGKD